MLPILRASTLALLAMLALPAFAQQATAPQDGAQSGGAAASAAAQHALSERTLGDPAAPVVMTEYASLTCGHCAAFHQNILPQLKTDYIDTGKLRVVFVDFPLDGAALTGAVIARCLPDTADYVPFIDVLFQNQRAWARAPQPADAIVRYVRLAGIDQQTIADCIKDEAVMNGIVERQSADAQRHNIESTPTLIFNNGADRIVGTPDYATIKDKIEALLAAAPVQPAAPAAPATDSLPGTPAAGDASAGGTDAGDAAAEPAAPKTE